MHYKSYEKVCKKCESKEIKKDGFKRWKQRFKCKICWHVFQNKSRQSDGQMQQLWKEYSFWKQTYKELSEKHKVGMRKVQRILDEYKFNAPQIRPRPIVLLMDTTYFWDVWLMVFKEAESKRIVNFRLVKNENNQAYKEGVKELQEQWWEIQGIVCDGRMGLLTWFQDIPTQMCHFHQVAILRRYITKHPKLEANKDIKWLGELLIQTDKETFEFELGKYFQKYESFLKETRVSAKWKHEYIHKRTRSAYFSLKRNLKYLFTSYDYKWTIDIPNTTNALEWVFGHLKGKVRFHRWLKKERKIKLILSLLYSKT